MINLGYEMYCERELAKARCKKAHLKCLFYMLELKRVRKQIKKGRGFLKR